MQYSKPMIELVYEIRRRSPTELKPAIKLANPELFDELVAHYPNAATVTGALIKELFALAGLPWEPWLSDGLVGDERHVTTMYRGRIGLHPAAKVGDSIAHDQQDTDRRPKKSRMMYRGRVVG